MVLSTGETTLDSASAFLQVLRHEQSLSTAHRALRLRLAHAEGLARRRPAAAAGHRHRIDLRRHRLPRRLRRHRPGAAAQAVHRAAGRSPDRHRPRRLAQRLRHRQSKRVPATATAASPPTSWCCATRWRSWKSASTAASSATRMNWASSRSCSTSGAMRTRCWPAPSKSNSIRCSTWPHYPVREQTMQYNESDAAFVAACCAGAASPGTIRPGRSRGTSVDPLHDRIPAHTLVLFADAAQLPRNAAGTVRYHRDDATEERDTITAWGAARSLQPGASARHSWDYKQPGRQQLHGGRHARRLRPGRARQRAGGQPRRLPGRSPARRQRPRGRRAPGPAAHGAPRLRGQMLSWRRHACATSAPASISRWPTIPRSTPTRRIEREFLITELHASVRNNLPGDMAQRIERLLVQQRLGRHARK